MMFQIIYNPFQFQLFSLILVRMINTICKLNFESSFDNAEQLCDCIINCGLFESLQIMSFGDDDGLGIQKIFNGISNGQKIMIAPVMYDADSSIKSIVISAHCLKPKYLFVAVPYFTKSIKKILQKHTAEYPLSSELILCKIKF